MSAEACAQSLTDISGDDKLFPQLGHCRRLVGQRSAAQRAAAAAFSVEVGAMLARRGLAAGSRRLGPFTFAEVTETLWDAVADLLPLVGQPHKKQLSKKRRVKNPLDEAAFGRAGAAVLEAIFVGKELAAVYMEPLRSDFVVDHINEACADAFGHQADAEIIRGHVVAACNTYEPSLFLAKTIIRSRIADEVFGCALATSLRQKCFFKDWDLAPDAYECSAALARDAAISELLAKQSQLVRIKEAAAAGDVGEVRAISGMPMFGFEPRCKFKTKPGQRSDRESHRKITFAAAEMLVEFNAMFKSLPNTLGGAARFNARDPTACGLRNIFNKMSDDTALRRFIPILDIAVEEAVKAELAEARSSGRMSGFSWTSDESPEKYLRRNGIRLQITWAYVLLYKERTTWDQEEHRRTMPVMRRQYLLDLCNCYGKRGVDVFNILELQLQRIGLFRRQCSECSYVFVKLLL